MITLTPEQKLHLKSLRALVIAKDQSGEYDHSIYYSEVHGKVRGCAIGHAVAEKDIFPDLNLEFHGMDDNRGINVIGLPKIDFFCVYERIREYFGHDSYGRIFDLRLDRTDAKSIIEKISTYINDSDTVEAVEETLATA